MVKIFHNNRCAKSREACSILTDKKIIFETIDYLKNPPTENELKKMLKLLGIKAENLLRKNEPLFKEKFSKKKFSESEWIKILAKNPILIERPIVVNGNKAVIGRPPEKVLEII